MRLLLHLQLLLGWLLQVRLLLRSHLRPELLQSCLLPLPVCVLVSALLVLSVNLLLTVGTKRRSGLMLLVLQLLRYEEGCWSCRDDCSRPACTPVSYGPL